LVMKGFVVCDWVGIFPGAGVPDSMVREDENLPLSSPLIAWKGPLGFYPSGADLKYRDQ